MGPRVENVAIRAIVDDVLAEDESHKAKRKRDKDPEEKPKKSVRFKDVDDVHEFVADEDEKEVRHSYSRYRSVRRAFTGAWLLPRRPVVVAKLSAFSAGVQEDGPIKEHLLGQAWQKRQQTRDAKNFDASDTQFNSGNENQPEEDAEYDHLDGEEVSAFNMKDEEADGFNAHTGELVPRKTEDEDVARDPWLQSLQQEEVCLSSSFLNVSYVQTTTPLCNVASSLFRKKRWKGMMG